MYRLVDVYPYFREQKLVKFLIFKRSGNVVYPNQWRMIGGKVHDEEKYYEGAYRELKEETALVPLRFWAIPSLNRFYEADTDTIYQIPTFGAEINPDDPVILDDEHVDYKWVSQHEIGNFIAWPEQRRLMRLLADIVMNNEILKEWIIEIPA